MAPLHILITDDDQDKLMLISRAVRREFPHASIMECVSGKEAWQYFQGNRVDALITDHNMHPVDGIELIKRIRGIGSRVPIIMVSSHDEMKQPAAEAGADFFLSTAGIGQIGQPIGAFLRERGLEDRRDTRPA